MSEEIAAVFLRNDTLIELKDGEVHVNLDYNTLPVLALNGLLTKDADLVLAGLVLEVLVRNKEGGHVLHTALSHILVGGGNLVTLLRDKGYYTDEQTLGIKFIKVNGNGTVGIRFVKLPVLRQHLDIPLTDIDFTKTDFDHNPDVVLGDIEDYPKVKALFSKSDVSMDIFNLYVEYLLNDWEFLGELDVPESTLKLITGRLIEDLVIKGILSTVVDALTDVCEYPYPETIRLHGEGDKRALRVTYTVPVVDA